MAHPSDSSPPSPLLTATVTWFGSGLLPKAPGTWGSAAALPFGWALMAYTGPLGLGLAAVVVFFIGWWASELYMRRTGIHDPGLIVIDEVAGQWITLLPAPLDPVSYALGFLLFRIFDVLKPWPIKWLDAKVGGGFGVMIDDVLAGLFGAACLYAYLLWSPL